MKTFVVGSLLFVLTILHTNNVGASVQQAEEELASFLQSAQEQYDVSSVFIGDAFSDEEGKPLYSEYHLLFAQEGVLSSGVVQYRFPDGSLKALKYLDFSSGVTTPSFSITDYEYSYKEDIDVSSGEASILLSGDDGQSGRVSLKKGTPVIDAGFDQFVQKNWGKLIKGDKKTMDFLSPTRLQTIALRLRLNEKRGGEIEFYIEPKSFWVRLLVSPIKLYYDEASRRLLRYEGLTNIVKEPGENYVAKIVYRYPGETSSAEQFQRENFVTQVQQ